LEELLDEDGYLKIETVFSKHPEASDVLDFAVVLRRYRYDNEIPGPSLAHLKGFLVQRGYLPEEEGDEDYFDIFDERSHHAAIGYRVLLEDRHLVAKALKKDADIDLLASIAYLERLWVNPSLRGHNIALRLMREAQHVISRDGLLVLLKAHPDDFDDGDNEKLAVYYRSEKQLGFRPISKQHAGWLVAAWQEPVVNKNDETFLSLDVKETPARDENN
jgi:ribosomal protein S18 acetylase RimI-like enzyme